MKGGPNTLQALTEQSDGRREESQIRKGSRLPRRLGCQTKTPAIYATVAGSKMLFPITTSAEPSMRKAMNSNNEEVEMRKKATEKELSI